MTTKNQDRLGFIIGFLFIISCFLVHGRTFGQELLYHWSPTKRTPNSFTTTHGVENWVYKDGNTLICYNDKGDTVIIEYPINLDTQYEIEFLGDLFVGRYKNKIKKKKLKFKYGGNVNIEIDGSEIKQKRKSGKQVAKHKFTSEGWKDKDNKKLDVVGIIKIGDEIEIEFSDTVYTSESDSFSWQGTAAQIVDIYLRDAPPISNPTVNTDDANLAAGWDGTPLQYDTYILFPGAISDSIPVDVTIDSANLRLWTGAFSAADFFDVNRINEGWSEASVIYPDTGSPFSANSLDGPNESSWWVWDVKDIVDTIYSGAVNDSGFHVYARTPTANNLEGWYSSDHAVALQRPFFSIYFTPIPAADPKGIIPKYDSKIIDIYDNKIRPIYDP